MRGNAFRFAVLFLFLASGAASLIYQIVWTKNLVLIMGVTVYAISTVLSSFMAGLALGSFAFGRLADRIKKPLLFYAILECGIGLYAILIPILFKLITRIYIVLHEPAESGGPWIPVIRFVLCFLVLLVPTTLMGGTLPVLTKFFVNRERAIGLGVGLLYAVNTAGAVLGAFGAGFLLIPILGIPWTTSVAVCINLAVALLALLLVRSRRSPAGKPEAPPHVSAVDMDGPRFSPGVTTLVFWVIGLSGFAALGYEILWTRVLVYFLGPSTYAFSTMLSTFLVGIALGSFLIARFTDRMKAPVLVLGIIQTALGLSALAAVLLIDYMIEIAAFLRAALQGHSWWIQMGPRFALAALFMIVPTLLMGAAFPLAARIYTRGLDTLGNRVGRIYSINTLCAIFGSLITGFLLIPWLGLQRSMVVLVCLNLLLGAVLFAVNPHHGLKLRLALAALGILCMAGSLTFFENTPVILSTGLLRGRGDQPYKVLYCKEGIDASLAVIEGTQTGSRQLNINGTSTAYTDITDLQVHRLLAHIPMAVHPDPREVLIIGFGFGSTAFGTMQYGPERVDCVELVDDERDTARFFLDQNHGILEHDRFRFIAEDGRNFVLTTKNRYDVISLNAIHPRLGPALYTRDFFALCRDRLKPDGLICVWLPTTMLSTEEFRMLVRTFRDVFPATTFWYNNPGNTIVLGGMEDLEIDFEAFTGRLALPSVKADLEPVHLADPIAFLSLLIMLPAQVKEYAGQGALNTDDRPWIEFSRSMYPGYRVDMLERIFFTVKADPTVLFRGKSGIGGENAPRDVHRRFARYRKAWPYMVEGHLLSIGNPSEEERKSAHWCFEQALRLLPGDPNILFLYRRFIVGRDALPWRIQRILVTLKEGAAGTGEIRRKLASLYLEDARFDEALEVLSRLRQEGTPEDLDFLLDLARAFEGCGKRVETLSVLAEAAARFPEDARPHARLVWPLLDSDDPQEKTKAIGHARAAARIEESPAHLDLLGQALFETGHLEEAEESFERALERSRIIFFVYRFHLTQVAGAGGSRAGDGLFER